MTGDFDDAQFIDRLTPLTNALTHVDALASPVAARDVAVHEAVGHVLATDVIAEQALPTSAIALHDGFAVSSALLADAGPYAPTPLAAMPPRVDAGEPMPAGTNAVAPLDAIVEQAGRAQAVAPVAPGDGVLPAGADVHQGALLRPAGVRLRVSDVAALAAAGIARVSIRTPGVCVTAARVGDAAAMLIADAATALGCSLTLKDAGLADTIETTDADAVLSIGGTGSGRNDAAAKTLARIGTISCHGIAIRPGETAAIGAAGGRPVLLLPVRLDAALAVWLTLGRRLVGRLAGESAEPPGRPASLARKVASPLGLTEIVLVRRRGGTVEPAAVGTFGPQAMAASDGYILIPADSEGHAAGSAVVVHPLP